MRGGNLMSIKNSDAFLDDIISEIQKMKADPEKDTVARVLAMVFRVASKHNPYMQPCMNTSFEVIFHD